jgi:hypothetical protein
MATVPNPTPPPPTASPIAPGTPASRAQLGRRQRRRQPRPRRGDWWARSLVIAAVLTMIGTFLLAGIACWQGLTAVHSLDVAVGTFNKDAAKADKEGADKKVYDWQKFMVYKILTDGPHKEPFDFGYIRSEYLKAAEQQIQNGDGNGGPKLNGKDISDDTLRKILMDLHTDRVLNISFPGPKYIVDESAFKDLQGDRVYEWQRLMVYKIIVEGSAKLKQPFDFDYIKAEYLKAAQQEVQKAGAEDAIPLKGKDISDDTLNKILMNLHMTHVVYIMYPGPKYMIEEATFNPEGPRTLDVLAAERYAHDLLVTEPDRYTIDQLAIKIAEQNHLDKKDCRYSLDQLLHACFIKVGDGGKASPNLTPMGK